MERALADGLPHLGVSSPAMAEVVQNTQQEFWRPPTCEAMGAPNVDSLPSMPAACLRCGTEFMIGSRFCHSCGTHRSSIHSIEEVSLASPTYWKRKLAWLLAVKENLSEGDFRAPNWLRYLHFHEIKRWVGLPTAAFVAFMAGLGCIAGAIGVGLFYKASTLAEFQAVQLWRIEWLLAATASFVAGILLKKPSNGD